MQGRVKTRANTVAAQRRQTSMFDVSSAPSEPPVFNTVIEHPTIQSQVKAVFENEDDAIAAFELIGKHHQEDVEKQVLFKTNMRKHNGVYYTPYSVAYRIISDTLAKNPPTLDRLFLEPCAGNGVFVIAYIDYVISVLKLQDQHSVQHLLDRTYCADIDPKAMLLLDACIEAYMLKKYGFVAKLKKENLFVGNALYQQNEDGVIKVDLRDVFNRPKGFDYIFTNPPYKLLKANSDRYDGDDSIAHKQELKQIIDFLKKGNYYPFSQGALNLYKLFVEDISTRYLKEHGGVGLLVPQTILNDKHSTELRKLIIERYELTKVYVIPEQASFFEGITQAFCLFGFNDTIKKSKTFEVVINVRDGKGFARKGYKTSADKLLNISVFEPVIITDESGYKILNKIHAHPSVRENTDVQNLRGELDLTLNKENITKEPTPYKLIRGAHISSFDIAPSDEHVISSFLEKSAKAKYAQFDRLVCQQISNMKASHRLKFALAPKNTVLANSVNFIHVNKDSSYSAKSLLALLNSTLLNWRFKLTSSNNHINNYEIDDLPLPVTLSSEHRIKLEACIDKLGVFSKQQVIEAIDAITAEIYSLSPDELVYVTQEVK